MALMDGMDAVIDTILTERFPERSVQDREQVPHGQVHTVYRVTFADHESVVIKLCQEHRFAERFGRELDLLPYLHDHDIVPVPEPIYIDRDRETVPYRYIVMAHVAGENGADAVLNLAADTKYSFLEGAGRLLAQLHDHTTFDACGHPAVQDDDLAVINSRQWPDLYRETLATAINGIGRTRFSDLVPRLSDAADTAAAQLAPVDAPVLLKHDHSPGNMIIRDGTIAAVLDWEGAMIGPARYDVFQAERKCVDRYATDDEQNWMRDAFQSGYESVRSYPALPDVERQVYQFGSLIGTLWGFPWSMQDASKAQREERAAALREKISGTAFVAE